MIAAYAVRAEQAHRLQNGRYSLRVDGTNMIVNDGLVDVVFDLSRFVVTSFDPAVSIGNFPVAIETGVVLNNGTLVQALELIGQYCFGLFTRVVMNGSAIDMISGSVSSVESKVSGFNADGTELTVTKLNGYRLYGTGGGSLGATPGPAPWIVGVKDDGDRKSVV